MKRICFVGVLFLTLSIPIFSQSSEIKLQDEFGAIGLDDLMARLDAFAGGIYASSDTKGFIRISGGDGKSYDSPYLLGGTIQSYLLRNRGLSSERFQIDYCKINKKPLVTQLYIYEDTAVLKKCSGEPEVPNKTTLFAEVMPWGDGVSFEAVEEMDIQIAQPKGQYSKESLKHLKRFLDDAAESKVYVVAIFGKTYEDYRKPKTKVYKRAAYKRMRSSAKKVLVENGVRLSRIEFVDLEKQEEYQRFQFWFVPKTGEIPNP